MKNAEEFITIYFGLNSKETAITVDFFENERLPRQSIFCNEGSVCNQLSFIKPGYLRIYKQTEEKEITQWICGPGELVTDISGLMFDLPSNWNIEALTEVELFTISKKDFRLLPEYINNWKDIENRFLAKCFITIETRVFSFLSMSALERYEHFIKDRMRIFNFVPHHFIASMLGMSPETLSRIRKQIKG